ncbi:hypothetical protein ACSQ67_017013 [Phaseolus vulgaris]
MKSNERDDAIESEKRSNEKLSIFGIGFTDYKQRNSKAALRHRDDDEMKPPEKETNREDKKISERTGNLKTHLLQFVSFFGGFNPSLVASFVVIAVPQCYSRVTLLP